MNAQFDVREHLRTEILAQDPWLLSSNPFEHLRYATMLNMIRARGPFRSGLEVGCAAGFFTKFIAEDCAALHIIDVLPQAIERAAANVTRKDGITWEVASIADDFAAGTRFFDLIVVAEVLAYLPTFASVQGAIAKLSQRLAPGGLLIFGSATDGVCGRWGLTAGAETMMREWERTMREIDRTQCVGAYWGENCMIAAYTGQHAPTPASGDLKRNLQEVNITPFRSVERIPAKSVLVLAPHPDDEVYGCAGAILSHVKENIPVRVIILSDGGGALTGEARRVSVRRRAMESRAAATTLGYGEPSFWGIEDRTITYTDVLVNKVIEALGDADLIYAPSPSELHPDHRNLALIAIEAVRRAGSGRRLALYEISAPLQPNVLVDISAYEYRKHEAMSCFVSQLQHQKYDLHIAALNRFRTYTLPSGVTAAEAFHLVSCEELERDPLMFHWREHDRRCSDAAERALRQTISQMRNSTSWKVTKPLRAIARRLRNFLHSGPPAVAAPLRYVLRSLRRAYHRVIAST